MKALIAATVALGATAGMVMAETRIYDITDFSRIDASSGLDVRVEVGGAFRVEAEALSGDLDRLEVDRVGDRLELGRQMSVDLFSGTREDRFRVTVSLPRLEALELRSGSSAAVTGDAIGLEAIAVRSGADLAVAALTSDALSVQVASGSATTLAGSCAALSIEATGGSSVEAAGLTCDRAEIEARSGSSVEVMATGAVTAQARSGASIDIHGGASVNASERSGGSVRRR
ncbi:DUF2807 domain-containing protein [Gymnodinialimonas sp. 2305UL16-5]|uniref:GIN domain-containing protein n=1 Tax=Gymnodinialimonas mytili TaxID=3126503 RepID=UPI0030B409BB